jgi:transglutaminase-like putative cysteine protease
MNSSSPRRTVCELPRVVAKPRSASPFLTEITSPGEPPPPEENETMSVKHCGIAIACCLLLADSAPGAAAIRQKVGTTGTWSDTRAAAASKNWIYTVEKDSLYRTNPYTGEWSQLGTAGFGNTQNMFALGPWLYTITTDGSLLRVGPGNGGWERVGREGDYARTITGVAWQFDAQTAREFNLGRRATLPTGTPVPPDELDGILLTVETNGGLYATTPSNGAWLQVGKPQFADTRFMFFVQGWLYTIEADGNLYQVHPALGDWRKVGASGAWQGTIAGAVLNHRIYTADEDGGLYETVPSTGEYRLVASSGFEETGHMVAVADALYTIDLDGSLFRSEVGAAAKTDLSTNVPPATRDDATSDTAKPSAWYAVERTPTRRIRAVYRAEYTIADVKPDRWTFTTALAPDLPSQSGVTTTVDPAAKVVREPNGEGRLLLISSFDSSATRQPVTITYEATLWKRRLVRAPNKPVPSVSLDALERSRYLSATRTFDFEATPFQEWLDGNRLRRGETENAVDFGRRVYSVILGQYRSREQPGMIKGEPASVFCGRDTADCKVRAVVFAAAMRANGIPARVMGGIMLKAPADVVVPSHLRAEFFLAEAGWVPVEFNYALDDPQDAQAHFGEDNGDLLVHEVGTDISVPQIEGDARVVYGLERPNVSVWGKGSGTITYRALTWDVTTLPISAEEAAAIPTPAIGPIARAEEVIRPTKASGGLSATHTKSTIRPLGNDLFRVTIEHRNAAGDTKTFIEEGTKDELRVWARSLTALPEADVQNLLEDIDFVKNKASPPSSDRPVPPESRPSTAAAQPAASPRPTAPQPRPFIPPTMRRPPAGPIPTSPSSGVAPAPSAGGTTGSFNIKPLGDGRYQLDMTYEDAAGEKRSRKLTGTKDELRAALESDGQLPTGARNSALMLVDRVGQVRKMPPSRGASP